MGMFSKSESEVQPTKPGDKIKKVDSKIASGLLSANRGMVYIAAIGLFVMMMVTVVDVIGRYIFNHPILGAYELVGFHAGARRPLGDGLFSNEKRNDQSRLFTATLLQERSGRFLPA